MSCLWDTGPQINKLSEICKMQTIFKDKGGKTTKNKPIGKVKVTNASINMVDVHVTVQSKVIEEQVFKEQNPKIKNKIVVN